MYLKAIKVKELEKTMSKEEISIAITWGKKKDWFDIYNYKGESYIVINPKYGGIIK